MFLAWNVWRVWMKVCNTTLELQCYVWSVKLQGFYPDDPLISSLLPTKEETGTLTSVCKDETHWGVRECSERFRHDSGMRRWTKQLKKMILIHTNHFELFKNRAAFHMQCAWLSVKKELRISFKRPISHMAINWYNCFCPSKHAKAVVSLWTSPFRKVKRGHLH